jgi:uncharacterized membrane protein (UPF0127 family)
MPNPLRSWFALPMATVVITRRGQGVATLHVEVARTIWRRARGLMGRTGLAADGGMLFAYPWRRKVRIWMAGVPIALDVLFIDDDGKVAKIVTDLLPRSVRGASSDVPVRQVLEIAAGASARAGIAVGDRLQVFLDDPNSGRAPTRMPGGLRARVAQLIGRWP